MITKAQFANADIAFRAERGKWFVVKNLRGPAGIFVSSDDKVRLIRENRAKAGKFAIRIVYFKEGEAAV